MFTEKMTIVEKFNVVAQFLAENDQAEMAEFILDRATKAQKKSSSKPKALTDEQVAIRNEIVALLEGGSQMSIGEMQKASALLGGYSTSKVSGNLTPMLEKNGGSIKRIMDKKVAKFYI